MNKIALIIVSLVLALVVGLAGCIAPPAKMVTITTTVTVTSTLKAEVTRLEGELADTKAELANTKAELANTKAELSDVNDELEILRATKEMVFGEGLRIFDISHDEYGNVKGEVQNISDKPMERVKIIVAFYVEEGTLLGLDVCTVSDLFPQETAEWSAFRPYIWYGREVNGWDVYAIGNRKD